MGLVKSLISKRERPRRIFFRIMTIIIRRPVIFMNGGMSGMYMPFGPNGAFSIHSANMDLVGGVGHPHSVASLSPPPRFRDPFFAFSPIETVNAFPRIPPHRPSAGFTSERSFFLSSFGAEDTPFNTGANGSGQSTQWRSGALHRIQRVPGFPSPPFPPLEVDREFAIDPLMAAVCCPG